jgi:hypothetical protein
MLNEFELIVRGLKLLLENDYGIQTLRDDHTYYTIETGDMVYVAERGLRSRHDKPVPVNPKGG